MTPAVRPVMAAPDSEIEPLIRSARASVARIALQVRTTQYEVERVERSPSDEDRDAASTLLATSLAELVEDRRRDLLRGLDEARTEAAHAVSAARQEAAARALAATAVVDDQRPAEPSAATAVAAPPVAEPAADRPVPWPDPVTTVAPPPDPPVAAGLRPEELGLLVQAAVTASLSQITAAAIAANATAGSAAPTQVLVRRPLWRRFLYLDVALPLIAVLAVVVVLLAWVG